MISIDPATGQLNLPQDSEPTWFALPVQAPPEMVAAWVPGQVDLVVQERHLSDREDHAELREHLTELFSQCAAIAARPGFDRRLLFLPDPTGVGIVVDVGAGAIDPSVDVHQAHRELLAVEVIEGQSGSYVNDLSDLIGGDDEALRGLLTLQLLEVSDPRTEDGPGAQILGRLACVLRREHTPIGAIDLVAHAVSDDLEIIALAMAVIPTFIQGDEIFSE